LSCSVVGPDGWKGECDRPAVVHSPQLPVQLDAHFGGGPMSVQLGIAGARKQGVREAQMDAPLFRCPMRRPF
jgi:hypothetical protein